MTNRQSPTTRFTTNAAPLAIGQVGANALLLLNAVLLARVLGPESFGVVAIGLAVFGVAVFVSDAGLGMWGIRAIVGVENQRETAAHITAARLLTSMLTLIVAIVALNVLPLPQGSVGPAVVMAFAIVPASLSVEWALLGTERTERVALVRLVVAIAMVCLSPVLATVGGPAGAAMGHVLATACGALLSWVLLTQVIGRPMVAYPGGIGETIRRSLPMGANGLLGQIYWQSDSLLTGMLLGNGAAGLYSAPMRLLGMVHGFGWIIGASLLPIYRSRELGGTAEASALATAITRVLILACLPAAGAAVGGADQIVMAVFGGDFAESGAILRVGSVTLALWLCALPLAYAILGQHGDKLVLGATSASVVSSLGLILALSPAHGIVGIALAMLISMVVMVVVLLVGGRRLGLRLGSLRTMLAAGGLTAIFALIAAGSVPWGPVGVVVVGVLAEIPFGLSLFRLTRQGGLTDRVDRAPAPGAHPAP